MWSIRTLGVCGVLKLWMHGKFETLDCLMTTFEVIFPPSFLVLWMRIRYPNFARI